MTSLNDVELHGVDRLMELYEELAAMAAVIRDLGTEIAEIEYAGRRPRQPPSIIYSPHIWLDIIEGEGEFATAVDLPGCHNCGVPPVLSAEKYRAGSGPQCPKVRANPRQRFPLPHMACWEPK